MITLWVSHNCGGSYVPCATYNSVQDQAFIDEANLLNRDMIRWYVADESGNTIHDVLSARHKSIIDGLSPILE